MILYIYVVYHNTLHEKINSQEVRRDTIFLFIFIYPKYKKHKAEILDIILKEVESKVKITEKETEGH